LYLARGHTLSLCPRIEDGFIKIEFFHSAKNDSELFTENISQESYERHAKEFLEDSGGYGMG
jgi:hypothetical protein